MNLNIVKLSETNNNAVWADISTHLLYAPEEVRREALQKAGAPIHIVNKLSEPCRVSFVNRLRRHS